MSSGDEQAFTEFFAATEPRLRRAFVAAYGSERGMEATAEALAYGWQHWSRLRAMQNPAGYLYRVGQSRTRPRRQPDPSLLWEPPASGDRRFEPGLVMALARLTEPQRVTVVLVHGFEWTLREVAELTGVAVSTVQTHLERGMRTLRDALETEPYV